MGISGASVLRGLSYMNVCAASVNIVSGVRAGLRSIALRTDIRRCIEVRQNTEHRTQNTLNLTMCIQLQPCAFYLT